MSSSRTDVEETFDRTLQDEASRVVELSDTSASSHSSDVDESDAEYVSIGGDHPGAGTNPLPPWVANPQFNLIHDDLVTETAEKARDVLDQCLPLLTGQSNGGLPLNSHGIPRLRKEEHARFLRNTLRALPAPYVAMDASRPWVFYWAMAGLCTLGEDVSMYKEKLQGTLRPLQNKTGGFGGGHGQLSHCACSYACVLALACVDGLDMVDRKAMWHWLGSLKQTDGGFQMAIDAEKDIRGAYCAMTIITLLNLPLELPPNASVRKDGFTNFTDKLGEWVGSCQTYEGGIASAPGNEAHGAYAFCGLACLSILDAPQQSLTKYLDLKQLTHCLTTLQTTPEGGFAGRTNKLVDACYSWWVGGCWALLEAAAISESTTSARTQTQSLWNREALLRYLLCCAQQPGKAGGMRDKPSTRPDGYHTNYSLAGMSAAQHHYSYDGTKPTTDSETGRLLAAFNWHAERPTGQDLRQWKLDDTDVVEFVHPVFVIPMRAVHTVERDFKARGDGFSD